MVGDLNVISHINMSTAAVDEAIRAVSVELAKSNEEAFIGKTEAEKEVLATYRAKGQRRGALGAVLGSSVMGGLWRASRNPRKLLGGIAMISGGIFGASYGILSIRRGMFMDILMLPGDKSPFAGRARDILQAKLPSNAFVQELTERFSHSSAYNDSWSQEVPAPGSLASKTPPSSGLPPPPRRYDNEVSSSLPPITGLDTPRDRERANDWQREDPEAFGEPNDSQRRSPFSFGAKQPPADDATNLDGRDLPPLSRDPYAHYSRDSRHPEADKNMPPLRHDEDEYFFDAPSDGDAPTKPTTWEEIRRRAAEQRK